jgi:site-specific recombinase
MLASAAGGGVLTCGTAALKIAISAQNFPLFVEGFLAGCNYALSFVVMQFLGFTLATKQPSMTAATLAGVFRGTKAESDPRVRTDALVTQIARICRSQLAAAMGNISTVAIAAFGLDMLWRRRYARPFLSVEKADAVMQSFNPIGSLTIWYAMLTGIILWLSSLAAGWIENWSVYRRLPQAIAEHRMGRVLGEGTMQRLSVIFARNISGVGGSVALGFMLGMAPVVGRFFGLPIDVRHVTLSSGTLVLAVAAHGPELLRETPFLLAFAGIWVIFACNLGVSFILALTVALRAREVTAEGRARLVAALIGRFLRSPREFLLPPRAGADAPGSH